MKKTTCIIAILLLAFFNSSVAQKRGNDAVYDSAMIYFSLENYQHALPLFQKIYMQDSGNANIAYHIGVCYKHMPSEKNKAIPYLKKACDKVSPDYTDRPDEQNAPVLAYYYLGTAYLINYDLDEATIATEKYKTFLNEESNGPLIRDADRQIQMCNVAREMIKNPIPIDVENLGSHINTIYPEYAPVADSSGNSIIFTTRRNTNIGEMMEDNGYYFEDIYISGKDNEDKWAEALNMGENINSFDHEASISLSPDNKFLYIYKDDGGDGNIYVSIFSNNDWGKPQKLLAPVNSGSWETHASLSPEENTLYFTSDRKGGYGGLDIYKASRMPNGKWGNVENLGATINTEFNEDGPFILSNNTLYFCSQGHRTMGGYDIFFSKFKKNGQWSEPVNIGYPINTTDDDMFYTPFDSTTAYFASVRAIDDFGVRGFGNLDIYKLTIHNLIIKGLAIDKQTNEIIPGTKVTLMDDEMNVIAQAIADDKGAYSFGAEYGRNYKLQGEKENYLDGNNTASTVNIGTIKEVTADLLLEKAPLVSLKILVADAKTRQPLNNVSVTLKDVKSGEIENLFTNENGEILKTLKNIKIQDSLKYDIQFSKEGHITKNIAYSHQVLNFGEILISETLEKIEGIRISGLTLEKQTKEIIPGAEVTLMNDKMEVIAKTLSDATGAFNFSAELNKKYNLKAQKNSYADGFNSTTTIDIGNTREVKVNLLLEQILFVSVKIRVIDAKTNQPVKDAYVILNDKKSGTVENLTTNENGEILKPLGNKNLYDSLRYELKISKQDYQTKDVDYRYRIVKPGEIVIVETIGVMEVGADLAKIFQINPIYFDLDKYNIRPDAAIELDKIVRIMNEYPAMVIELGSHTDCRASYAYNITLSNNRAKSSAAYIKQRITNPDRIYGKGYGETKLVNECECEGKTMVPCTEEQHQMNRRTEFIIVKY